MAKTYQYCVAENWGKGFIDHDAEKAPAVEMNQRPADITLED